MAGDPLTTVVVALLPPFTVSVKLPAGIPVPLSGTVAGEPGSELVIVSAPDCAPAAVGANVTVTEQLAPAANAATPQGAVMAKLPLTANVTAVIGVVPVLSTVNERLAVLPTFTVPKISWPGVICRCGCAPAPESATPNGRGAAELAMDSVPVRVPLCDGANATCSVQLAPGASVPPCGGHVPAATE